ncbi:hypothetical protein CBL_11543 [Carabus blaptoides fortunei]
MYKIELGLKYSMFVELFKGVDSDVSGRCSDVRMLHSLRHRRKLPQLVATCNLVLLPLPVTRSMFAWSSNIQLTTLANAFIGSTYVFFNILRIALILFHGFTQGHIDSNSGVNNCIIYANSDKGEYFYQSDAVQTTKGIRKVDTLEKAKVEYTIYGDIIDRYVKIMYNFSKAGLAHMQTSVEDINVLAPVPIMRLFRISGLKASPFGVYPSARRKEVVLDVSWKQNGD